MREDLTGRKFGQLTVMVMADVRRRQSYWNCQCLCGQTKVVRGTHLKAGKIISCGCYGRAVIGIRAKTHGKSRTIEYKTWTSMINRCESKNCPKYPIYGGRGILVCDRWRNSFEHFLADMGIRPSPKHSIDRKDVNKNYEPENCRWATAREQSQNQRKTVNITFQGETACVTEWARRLGVSQPTLHARLKRWPVEKAFKTGVYKNGLRENNRVAPVSREQ